MMIVWTTGHGALPETEASPRVKFFGESLPLGSRRRALWRESNKKFSAKKKLSAKKLKKSFFHQQIFLSPTCTYTKDMFKFDAILPLFAIFKNFNSF
jgi:hypothetical protein